MVTALVQAEELGAPLSDALIALGGDMRRYFAQDARRRAARAAPRVSLVITMVMVPGALVLMVVGIFLGSGINLGSLGH
jgi:tight adherence protein C